MRENPIHILAVDDDATSRLMLRGSLEAQGYRVSTAENGLEAFDVISNEQVNLVISDWNMPEMDGVELCRAVRGLHPDHYIYFILLTSRNSKQEIVSGLEAGADDYIAKPFDPAELSTRVKVGIRTASLDTRDAAIFALAKLAESRDPETGAHLERVQNYSRLLTIRLAESGRTPQTLNAEFVRLIYSTTPLHDIGKVAIPDSILLKPGHLTDSEFEIMKSHTTVGAETLAAVLEKYPQVPYLKMAHDIALYHHERWDGSGYPHGLAGEDIPLPARIMAVADVYDALVSKRVYKNALEHNVAFSIIREGSGSHFDPDIVDAFLTLNSEVQSVRQQYDDTPPPRLAA
ncbi:MAG: HD domain-containing phosphohydrolase [Phycisphaerales bacterium JB040]